MAIACARVSFSFDSSVFGVGHCEQVGGAWSASVSLGAVGVLHIWRGHWRELPTRSESCRAGRRFHPFRIGFAHSISPPPLLTRLGGLRRGRLSRGARRRPSRHLSFLEHWAIAIYIRSTLPRKGRTVIPECDIVAKARRTFCHYAAIRNG